MDPHKSKKGPFPETKLRGDLISLMETRGWYCKIIHGNAYTNGIPDFFAAHINYGYRWIETKNADSYHFTDAQKREFPLMSAKNVGIWVVALPVGFTESQLDYEYRNVIVEGGPNWGKYWGRTRRPY